MSDTVVILADTDTSYLSALELQFARELPAQADLIVISDAEYFEQFFSTPRKAQLLIISEQLYRDDLSLHDIANIHILTELAAKDTDAKVQSSGEHTQHIFKYSSTQDIYQHALCSLPLCARGSSEDARTTHVVVFYSAAGGTGKTTTALGTAACLAANHKRVIYLDAEYLHTFQCYLTDKSPLSAGAYQQMQAGGSDIYGAIRHYIKNELFDYLPPFGATLDALGLTLELYTALITQIKESGAYDYLIVDVDSSLGAEKVNLLNLADRLVILLTQERSSVFKTEVLANSLSLHDKDKDLFVCTQFDSERANRIVERKSAEPFIVSEYIEFIGDMDFITVAGLSTIKGFQKMAFLLM